MFRQSVQKIGLSCCVHRWDDQFADLCSSGDGGTPIQQITPCSPYAPCLLEEIVKHCISLREEMVLRRREKVNPRIM